MTTQNDEWDEVRIGNIGQVLTGRTPPTENSAYFGSDFPFITPGDMHQGKYARHTQRCVSNEGAKLLTRIRVPANSVCVSCIGWQMGEVIMTDKPSYTNQQINTVVPNDSVNADFLYYSIRTRKQELLSLGATSGVRTPILNKSAFSDLKINLPPLPTQQRIASILSAYDELIENNQRRINILETMVRSLYREWFVHFRYPGYRAASSVTSALGPLPKGWNVTHVKDVVMRLTTPKSYRNDEVMPSGQVLVIDQSSDELLGYHNNQPDCLATADSPIAIFGDHTCKMQLLTEPFSIGPNVVPFVAQSDYPTAYIYYVVNNLIKTQEYKRHWTTLNSKEVIVSDKATANRFAMTAEANIAQQVKLAKINQNLRKTRNLLLPRLMEGKIDV